MRTAGALPDRMPAAVYRKPRELSIEERPLPDVAADEALLEVSHCGICGTDLHLVIEGMGQPDSIGGHEYSGRIVALGDAAGDRFALGEYVVGGGAPACGQCACCRAGRPSLCDERDDFGRPKRPSHGAFAGYKRLPVRALHKIPEGVTPREAALTEPLAVAMHAVTVSGIQPGQRALVTGAGPVGTLVLAALIAHGVDDVDVSEPGEVRRNLAGRIGARQQFQPDDLNIPAMPFGLVDHPYDVAFECSGNPRAMESGLAQLRRMGRLVIVGTGMRRPKLDHNRILMNELVVTGAYCYDDDGFGKALALLASGRLRTDLLIEPDDVPLPDLLATLERLAAGELGGKVMVVPR